MVNNKNIELRLTITPGDPLYQPFSEIKTSLGIKSNSEVGRFILKQISKIPISDLILDFRSEVPDSIKKQKKTKKEVKGHE